MCWTQWTWNYRRSILECLFTVFPYTNYLKIKANRYIYSACLGFSASQLWIVNINRNSACWHAISRFMDGQVLIWTFSKITDDSLKYCIFVNSLIVKVMLQVTTVKLEPYWSLLLSHLLGHVFPPTYCCFISCCCGTNVDQIDNRLTEWSVNMYICASHCRSITKTAR